MVVIARIACMLSGVAAEAHGEEEPAGPPEPTESHAVTVGGMQYLGSMANNLDVKQCLQRVTLRNKKGEVDINSISVTLWVFYNLVQAAGGWAKVRFASQQPCFILIQLAWDLRLSHAHPTCRSLLTKEACNASAQSCACLWAPRGGRKGPSPCTRTTCCQFLRSSPTTLHCSPPGSNRRVTHLLGIKVSLRTCVHACRLYMCV